MPLLDDDGAIRDVLRRAETVAVIGVSANPTRASHEIALFLINQTHLDVFLVNPTVSADVLGQRVYPSLADLPIKPDIIDVFRRGEDMPDCFATEFPAIASAASGRTWWMQLGISNAQVAAEADAAGMNVVQDRCILVEYRRLIG